MKKAISIISAVAILLCLCSCYGGAVRVSKDEVNIPSNTACSTYFPIMETENGFYYTMRGYYTLRYHDKASDRDIFCCNKPECAHDGNSYCAATSSEYDLSYAAMYDGAIYVPVTKLTDDTLEYKLLRVETDGTARSEVCTFLTLKNANPIGTVNGNDLILHKGKAFVHFSYEYRNEYGISSNEMINGIMVIDLSSGDYYELPTDMLDFENSFWGQIYTRADGDWFYYTISYDGAPEDECDVYRYNFVSGETEKLDMPRVFSSYTVWEGCVYYTKCDVSDKDNKTVQIYRYYPDNGVTEKFTENPIPEETIVKVSCTAGNDQPEITTDGKYFYYVNNGLDSNYYYTSDKVPFQPECIVFSNEGVELARFMLPTELLEHEKDYCMNVVNGKVYFQSIYSVWSCSVDDILSGNVSWSKMYSNNV